PSRTLSTFRAWSHEVEETRGCRALSSAGCSNCQAFRLSLPGLGPSASPPEAPLEFPTAGQGDDVLRRAQAEGLNGERRRIPSALPGEHTRVGDEQVGHLVGAPEG